MSVGYTGGSGDFFTNCHLFVICMWLSAIYRPSKYVEPREWRMKLTAAKVGRNGSADFAREIRNAPEKWTLWQFSFWLVFDLNYSFCLVCELLLLLTHRSKTLNIEINVSRCLKYFISMYMIYVYMYDWYWCSLFHRGGHASCNHLACSGKRRAQPLNMWKHLPCAIYIWAQCSK